MSYGTFLWRQISCSNEVNSGTWWQEAQANEYIMDDEYL